MKLREVKNPHGHVIYGLLPETDSEAKLVERLHNFEPNYFTTGEGNKRYCELLMKRQRRKEEETGCSQTFVSNADFLPFTHKQKVEWLRKNGIVVIYDRNDNEYIAVFVDSKGRPKARTDIIDSASNRTDCVNEVFSDRWYRQVSLRDKVLASLREMEQAQLFLERNKKMVTIVKREQAAARKARKERKPKKVKMSRRERLDMEDDE